MTSDLDMTERELETVMKAVTYTREITHGMRGIVCWTTLVVLLGCLRKDLDGMDPDNIEVAFLDAMQQLHREAVAFDKSTREGMEVVGHG